MATPSPFPLINSRSSITTAPLAVSHLSYTRRTCTLAFAVAPPPRPHIALDLLLALHQMLPFSVVGIFAPSTSLLAASPSYSSHGPSRLRRTMTSRPARPHAHCFYILDTGLYSTLDFAPAFSLSSSHFCLPLFAVHLACTARTSRLPRLPS
ncbi:hypothetical protein B0H13DRAFT_2365204 [Mycena leptocephala]|nr:hypothetical protein B0H13DRAFT_2365204 [Mycena leptocephala]